MKRRGFLGLIGLGVVGLPVTKVMASVEAVPEVEAGASAARLNVGEVFAGKFAVGRITAEKVCLPVGR